MTKAFEEMKTEIASKMTPQEFNQFVLDYACANIHDHCMEHCLDSNQEEYEMWAAQRDLMKGIVSRAATAAQAYDAYINRFNTHRIPLSIYRRRNCGYEADQIALLLYKSDV